MFAQVWGWVCRHAAGGAGRPRCPQLPERPGRRGARTEAGPCSSAEPRPFSHVLPAAREPSGLQAACHRTRPLCPSWAGWLPAGGLAPPTHTHVLGPATPGHRRARGGNKGSEPRPSPARELGWCGPGFPGTLENTETPPASRARRAGLASPVGTQKQNGHEPVRSHGPLPPPTGKLGWGSLLEEAQGPRREAGLGPTSPGLRPSPRPGPSRPGDQQCPPQLEGLPLVMGPAHPCCRPPPCSRLGPRPSWGTSPSQPSALGRRQVWVQGPGPRPVLPTRVSGRAPPALRGRVPATRREVVRARGVTACAPLPGVCTPQPGRPARARRTTPHHRASA